MDLKSLDLIAKIKWHREQKAANEVLKAKQDLEQAREELISAEQALDEYMIFKKEEEQRLYDFPKGKLMRVKDIDNIKLDLNALTAQQLNYEQVCKSAEVNIVEKEKSLQLARDVHLYTQKQVNKINEMIKYAREEHALELEALENGQLEEIAELLHQYNNGR